MAHKQGSGHSGYFRVSVCKYERIRRLAPSSAPETRLHFDATNRAAWKSALQGFQLLTAGLAAGAREGYAYSTSTGTGTGTGTGTARARARATGDGRRATKGTGGAGPGAA